jgi:hypothetical protein
MTAVTLPAASSSWRGALGFAWRAWTGTTRRQWAWALLIGLVVTLVMLPHRFDSIQKVGWQAVPALTEMLLPLLATVPMFLGWVLADAGSDAWRSRRTRLVYALLASGAVATLVTIGSWHLAGAADLWDQYAATRGKLPRSGWLMTAADYIRFLLVGSMIYAVAEVACQRSRTRLAFEAAARQQAALEQELLESRLAAMQAQVEPRFLFDTLVDIEALYERDPQRAAEDLDRLIAYLRAALPRLREAGSSVEVELDLVRTYLAVVTSRHGGRPRLNITLADDCRRDRFYPMLLLPLVQRAVRHGALPDAIDIDVRREAGGTLTTLRYDAAGGCADDTELARVRERLAALYGKTAALDCVEAGGATELTMRLPAAATAR